MSQMHSPLPAPFPGGGQRKALSQDRSRRDPLESLRWSAALGDKVWASLGCCAWGSRALLPSGHGSSPLEVAPGPACRAILLW